MDVPGISFASAPAIAAADPNRMDIAMFVGFLPLRAGPEALAKREQIAAGLAKRGWEDRVSATGSDLTDLPVRVNSIESVEALFDTGGRVDRHVRLLSKPLPDQIDVPEKEATFVAVLDGAELPISLPTGTSSRAQLITALSAGLPGIEVTEADEANGKAALEFLRLDTETGAGSLTIYANAALGFEIAAHDQSRNLGAPTGVALRSFFAAGGREAVIVRMGDPQPLFAKEIEKVTALSTLIGSGFGAGASTIGELLADTLPQLPAEYPTRDPWHGLAHIHGQQDVAMVLLPDLPELVANRFGAALTPDIVPRPPETFQPCAPEPEAMTSGSIQLAQPASVTAEGLELWSRAAAWAAEQLAQVTPETMMICAMPLADEDGGELTSDDLLQVVKTGNRGAGFAQRQLQLVTPWVTSRSAQDMPAGAMPADGLMAGYIAASALAKGAWRTVAGRSLPPSEAPFAATPGLSFERAEQLSVIGYGINGPAILSDRTTDPEVFNQANVRRLAALIFRAARHRGETAVFDANGEGFWRNVKMTMTTLLRQLHSAGALRGLTEQEAFQVLCDRQTMSQADIDSGRAIAEVTFAPSNSLEFIEVSLLASGGALQQLGAGR